MSVANGRRSLWMLPVGMLIANILNMAGIIVLPAIIDADQFALFSLSSSVGLLVIALVYEGNRIAIMRYSVSPDADETLRRRTVLHRSNLFISLVLLCVSLVCYLFSDNHYALIGSMACIFAISQALFEARQAYFRADFRDRNYASSLLLRGVIGFILLVVAGYLSNNAFVVICAWAASFAIVLAVTPNAVSGLVKGPTDWATWRFLFNFGVGASLSAIATTLLSPTLRLLATEFVPLDESGKLMFAMDISQKIVGVLGVSINILTLQITIRAREFGDHELVLRRITGQISAVVAVLLPAVAGFIVLRNDLSAVFVSQGYTDVFLQNISWCMMAAGLLGFRLFALDSIFIVLGRPFTGILGPLFTIVITVGFALAYVLNGTVDTVVFSKSLFVGSLAGVVLSYFIARQLCGFTTEWKDVAKIVLASAAMVAVVWVNPFDYLYLRIAVSVLSGGTAYCCVLVALNAFGLRQQLRHPFFRRKEI